MEFTSLMDVTWFNFTQMPAVVVSSKSVGGLYIKLNNGSLSFDVYASLNNDTEISSTDSVIVKYNNKTGECSYINNAYLNSFSELDYTFTDYSSWYNPPFHDSYAEQRILIAFTFTKVVVEKTELKGRYHISGGFPTFKSITDSYGEHVQYQSYEDYIAAYLQYNGDFTYKTLYSKPQIGYSFYCDSPIRITDYTGEFVISTDDAMLAINNEDEDIESVDLYCDGVFVANVK